ncbi:hypothetical protein HUJ05_003031 [Dendroctonus ponderosae]|nr:hypothetical protein HUJ05_003031 [Dendroctonus ponderosae]
MMELYFKLVIFLHIFATVKSTDEDVDRPQLYVADNNLHLMMPQKGYINVNAQKIMLNSLDIISTLRDVQNVTNLMKAYEILVWDFNSKINRIETKILTMGLGSAPASNNTLILSLNARIQQFARRIAVVERNTKALTKLLAVNECASNPCQNGGTCIDIFLGFVCQCPTGWEGNTCSIDVNECTRFVGTDLGCQNGGTCINLPGTYQCQCTHGWIGVHCNRKSVDCVSGSADICGHGICVPQNGEIGYKCICDSGWTSSGSNPACTVDVDECKQNHPPCSTSPLVQCINLPGSFMCQHCPPGYTGNGYYCADLNECELFNGGCSLNPYVECINTLGSKNCGPCPAGYRGDGKTCTFSGICNINNGGCNILATCVHIPTISETFVQCTCPAGYSGSGIGPAGCAKTTMSIPSCNPNPCVHGICLISNVTQAVTCNCNEGFTGALCDQPNNPCARNPCWNGGTCNPRNNYRFTCSCLPGLVGRLCQRERQVCGETFNSTTGTLTYPPKDFESIRTLNNFKCGWTIETVLTDVVTVEFSKFNLADAPCTRQWLKVHDGRNGLAPVLGTVCGKTLPFNGSITSTQNAIYFSLGNTGQMNKRPEFELSWTTKHAECDYILSSAGSGVIVSPGWPNNYPNNRNCYWYFRVEESKRLLFHVYSLDIGTNVDCTGDRLEFSSYTTPSEDSYGTSLSEDGTHIFAKLCNSTIPPPFRSYSYDGQIYFKSDAKEPHGGFQIGYNLVDAIPGCGGTYTLREGYIQSIDLPKNIESILCTYEIQVPVDGYLELHFLDFVIEGTCKKTYTAIYRETALVSKQCGRASPSETIRIDIANGTKVFLKSQFTQGYASRWRVKYSTVCEKVFTDPLKTIKADPNSNCNFLIQQPLGNIIFLDLTLGSMASGARVYDGNSALSALYNEYTKPNEKVIIESNTNYLYIVSTQGNWTGSYTVLDIGCGGLHKDDLGTIAYPPRAQDKYLNDQKCRWIIQAPPGNVVQLTWLTFNVEQSIGCSYDSVKIFDNNTDPGRGGLLGTFCGYHLPPIMLSTSNIMTIYFSSDHTISDAGFIASYIFIKEISVCGGNYFTSAGVIKSPGYPESYPTNKECIWTITVPPGSQIMLKFKSFDLEAYSSCRYDYLEVRNGGSSAAPLIGRYCGETFPEEIPSHTNKLFLKFESDMSKTSRGFELEWTSASTGCGGNLNGPTGSIISPHYPEPYTKSTDCLWQINVNIGSIIRMVFVDLDLEEHTKCSMDYVELFDGDKLTSKSLGKFCSRYNEPITATTNVVLVRFRSDVSFQGRGFNLQYSAICTNTLTGFGGVIESPNFPNAYPQDQNCNWDIVVYEGNKINISFSDFSLEIPPAFDNNTCSFDYVEISYLITNPYEIESPDPEFRKVDRFCGNKKPDLITVESSHARIHFVSDNLLPATGFRLEWKLFGCGGILTDPSGSIFSPNYPNRYGSSVECNWQISVPLGKSIEIEFVDMDIERDFGCPNDYIQIFNGPDSTYPEITKICHQLEKTIVRSSGSNMFLLFKADFNFEGRGFFATYSSTSTSQYTKGYPQYPCVTEITFLACGGTTTSSSGYIFSPNYPKNYEKNETCEWMISVDPHHIIRLQFQDFDLDARADCKTDHVKVYDGPTQAYPVLTTLCGNSKGNQTIHSSYEHMLVEFRSGNHLTSKGFKAFYEQACGAIIKTSSSGIIKLRKEIISYSYEEGSVCNYTIEAEDKSKHVRLTVTKFVKGIRWCDDEYPAIKIYNGFYNSSPIIGSYCRSTIPPIISDGSALHIEIQMPIDLWLSYSVLESDCGGDLYLPEGYIASPGYAKRNIVSMNIITLDMPESDNCNQDYLEVREDSSEGKLLGVFCGTNKPTSLTAVGKMVLLFKSSNLSQSILQTTKGFYAEFSSREDNVLYGSEGLIGNLNYPDLSPSDMNTRSWLINTNTSTIIELTFQEFALESTGKEGECFTTAMKLYDGMDDEAPLLYSACGLVKDKTVLSTSNMMYIVLSLYSVRTDAYFLLKWRELPKKSAKTSHSNTTTSACTYEYTLNGQSNVTLSSPGYPNGYAHDSNCEWIYKIEPQYHLELEFVDLSLETWGKFRQCVFSDTVKVYTKYEKNGAWVPLIQICNNSKPDDRSVGTDLLKVEFSTNKYFNGSGFQAVIFGKCGGSLTEPNGKIIFNKDHAHDVECQWNITVRPGRTINIRFVEFDLSQSDPDSKCRNYLMVRNGKFADSPFLQNGIFCGPNPPSSLQSSSNYLYLKYVGSAHVKGFEIDYSEVSFSCGGSIRLGAEDSYTIQSPNYPNVPQPHTECIWIIRGPPGTSLQVEFEERFDISDEPRHDGLCGTDYVELRDGATEIADVIGTYCDDSPSTQFTSGNFLRVKYFTESNEPRNGFKAEVSIAKCGGTLKKLGTIDSKTSKIKLGSPCQWLLVVSQGYHISMTLDIHRRSDRPSVMNCNADNVSKITISQLGMDFINGFNKSDSELGTFCRNINSTVITSSTNKVMVRFEPKDDSYSFTLDFKWEMEECGGHLDQETGTLMSPGYPNMSFKNHYCWWGITVPKGRRISLLIEDLDIDELTFFLIFEGAQEGPKLIKRKDIKAGATYETSDNGAHIIYWQTIPSTRRGVKITYTSEKPTVCTGNFNTISGELHAPEGLNTFLCEYQHISNQSQTLGMELQLTIASQNSAMKKLVCPRSTGISISGINIQSSFCQSTNKRYAIARSVSPLTTITARQYLNTTLNFTVSFKTYQCGGKLNEAVLGQRGTISSPNFPNSSIDSVECAWLVSLSSSQIKINFTTFELQDDCDKNYVDIYNGESSADPHIGRYCNNNKPPLIVSQRENLLIEYKYHKTTNDSSKGFSLDYEPQQKGCGGIYQTNQATIQSPNYKQNYDNNVECIWDIETSEGTMINLVFSGRFHIEESSNCSKDFIEIFDWKGVEWTSLGRKCGRNRPNQILSSNNKMKIMFRSNENVTATGFEAGWSIKCGGKLLAEKEEKFLTSPPNINYNCTYEIISSKRNGLVGIRFEKFSLGDATHQSCSYRNLTIMGSPPRLSILHNRRRLVFCANNIPPTQMYSNSVTLSYLSSMAYNMIGGFKLAYREESCGGNISAPTALESHIAQRSTQFGVICEWYITAPSDQVVVLSIHKLNTSMLTNCLGPSVNIFDGHDQRNEKRLARLCGNIEEEKPIPSSSNTMLVKLTLSYSYISDFQAEVYFTYGPAAGCGGKINLTETTQLQMPTNLPHMDCHWTITTSRDYKVQLEFTDIQLSNACPNPVRNYSFIFCECSYAEVRDGAGPFAAQMIKLCTSTNGRNIKLTTSWNTAYVRLFSLTSQKELFKLTLTPVESKCGPSDLIAGKDFKELTSPDYPNSYPETIQCTWIIRSAAILGKILIHFEDFDFGTSPFRTSCDGDRLEIGEGRNQEIISEGFGPKATHRNINIYNIRDHAVTYAFCDNSLKPFDHYSSGQAVKLKFYSFPYSGKKGKGFKLKYALSGCNRTIESNDGRIQNDVNNKGDRDCATIIKADPNTTISIYFMTFYFINPDKNCTKFGLEIREGNETGPQIFKACGYQLPNPLFSNSSQLYIRSYNLNTRKSNAYYSYNLMYVASEKKYGCGGKIFNSMGMFSSPMYPNPYREDIECTWNILVPLDYKVALKFKEFNIGGGCAKNKLVVETNENDVPTVHTFCPGDATPAILYSKNSLTLTYYSSVNNGGNGWLAVFQPTKYESDMLLRI